LSRSIGSLLFLLFFLAGPTLAVRAVDNLSAFAFFISFSHIERFIRLIGLKLNAKLTTNGQKRKKTAVDQ